MKENPPPFLIVHGTKDVGTSRGQVPIELSIDFHEKLRQAGGEATLLKLEGAGHGFTGNGTNKYAQETLAAAQVCYGAASSRTTRNPTSWTACDGS